MHKYEVIGSRGGRYVVEARDEWEAAEAVAREHLSQTRLPFPRDENGWTWWMRATQPAILTRPLEN